MVIVPLVKKEVLKLPDWLFVLVNMVVAAFVGGVTNHLAIKMLFHPREKIVLFGRRLPFTPGLIPKRKQEIAVSLGNVVSDYLVTSEGIQELIRKPAFRNKIEDTAVQKLKEWSESEQTVGQLAHSLWGPEQWDRLKQLAQESARRLTAGGVHAIWREYELENKPLKVLVPGWSETTIDKWSGAAADTVLKELSDTLLSAEGQRLLRNMAVTMVDRAGGFLGAMAAIFVDEDKLVTKLTPMLVGQLSSEKVRETVKGIVAGKLEEYGEMPIGSLLEAMSGESGPELLIGKLEEAIPWMDWIERLEALQLKEILGPRMPWLMSVLPGFLEKGLAMLERGVPVAMKAVNLPQLVREQVEKFPVERLEEVILSVSGREFRAITWLGVGLGAVIGLFQSFMTLMWR